MSNSIYRFTDLVGTSTESWERAAQVAIEAAAGKLRDLRVARIVEQDIHIQAGAPLTYRVRMELSFKYDGNGQTAVNGLEQTAEVDLVDAALEDRG
jgi:flavin-binding protein dodecin